jgi:hypothetical protein
MCGFYGRHDDSIPAVFKVYQPFLWDGSGNGISLCEMLETVKKNKRKRTGAMGHDWLTALRTFIQCLWFKSVM